MLKIFQKLHDLRFSKLADVYFDGVVESDSNRLTAEQEFYIYLRDVFFTNRNSFYAVWLEKDRYVAALRLEPYLDGLLLEGLQTVHAERSLGFATLLLSQTLDYLKDNGVCAVYSHVEKNNFPSMRVHEKCGFSICSDTATFIDGSFSTKAFTYLYQCK